MKNWTLENINSIINGNNLTVLKNTPDNSIDSIITDIPYGLQDINALELIKENKNNTKGFMGKAKSNIQYTNCQLCNTELTAKQRQHFRICCSKKCSIEFHRGVNSPSWNGGKFKRGDGYVAINIGDDEKGTARYELEHRLVMSRHLGRDLLPNEQVHHRNEIRDDNRIENLELLTIAEHTKHHHKGVQLDKRITINCFQCNQLFERYICIYQQLNSHFCSIQCYKQSQQREKKCCESCGNEFELKPHGKFQGQKYCGSQCYFVKRRANAKHPIRIKKRKKS